MPGQPGASVPEHRCPDRGPAEPVDEPAGDGRAHTVEGVGILDHRRRPLHQIESVRTRQPAGRVALAPDGRIVGVHEEQRGRGDPSEDRAGRVDPPGQRDDGFDGGVGAARHDQRRAGRDADAEQSDRTGGGHGLLAQPLHAGAETVGQEGDVADRLAPGPLAVDEQIEDEGGQAGVAERGRHASGARAVAAVLARERTDDDGERTHRNGEPAVHLDVTTSVGDLTIDFRIVEHGLVRAACRDQERGDLVVTGLREADVELTHAAERLGREQHDDVVGDGRHAPDRRWCGHRRRDHDAPRATRPDEFDRGPDGPAGGQAVVDDHHDPVTHVEGRPAPTESCGQPLDLLRRVGADLRQLLVGHTEVAHHGLVDDAHAALTHGTHAHLGLERDTELAHDDEVERCARARSRPRRRRGSRRAPRRRSRVGRRRAGGAPRRDAGRRPAGR